MKTAFKTIRHGAMRIDVKEYSDGRFGFDYTPPGSTRVQVRHHDAEDAIERAKEILGIAHGGNIDRLSIDEKEFAEFLLWKANRRAAATVPDLVKQFIESRKTKGVANPTIRELKSTLTSFADAFKMNIADIQRADVEKWLNSRKVGTEEKGDIRSISPRRWNNMRAAICALYKFARRNHLLSAELTAVELIEKRKVTVTVQTYTPAQLTAMLSAVDQKWLPLIVLGAFAGIRPEEICPDSRNGGYKAGLKWENFLWSKKKIDIPAEVAKDRRRRFVPMCDALIAFLKPLKGEGSVVPFQTYWKYTKDWAKAAGCDWKKDGLRHSYASYRLALTKDIPALSLEMGNSATMLHRHYLDLKHEEEAFQWFAIRPDGISKK